MSNARVAWHRRPGADFAIRACGLLLLFVAWRTGTVLLLHGHAMEQEGLADAGLAIAAFLGGSAGVSATSLGAHLFDQVPITSRWGRTTSAAPSGARQASSGTRQASGNLGA